MSYKFCSTILKFAPQDSYSRSSQRGDLYVDDKTFDSSVVVICSADANFFVPSFVIKMYFSY
jgi:hypothetical protein